MSMSRARRITIAATSAAASVLLLPAASAFASAQPGSAAGQTFDVGPSPFGLPTSCPFPNADANFLFVSGNMVSHAASNNNGSWGGMTMEGTGNFYEGTTLEATGHLTIWQGGGNNAQSQTEGGFTVNFNGSGSAGSVSIHINGHMTTNAHGTATAHVLNVQVLC